MPLASQRTARMMYAGTEIATAIDSAVVAGNESGSSVVPKLGYVGVIGSGATATYNCLDDQPGTLVIAPLSTDTGTVTVTASGRGAITVYGKYSIGYASLVPSPGVNYAGFQLGANTLAMTESHFYAVLCRIPTTTAIEGNANNVNILQTLATGASGGRNMALYVGGSSASPSASRRVVSRVSEGWTASAAASLRIDESWTSTIAPTPSLTSANVKMSLFGDNSGRNGAPTNGWVWIFSKGTGIGENESSVSTLSMNQVNTNARRFTIGHAWVPTQWPMFPQTHMFAQRTGGSEQTVTSLSDNGAQDVFSSQSFVIGDTALTTSAKNIDVAAVIKLSARPTALEMSLLLQGYQATDLGITPAATDFQAYIHTSLTAFNASATAYGYAGTLAAEIGNVAPTYYTTGGPTMYRKLGVATNGSPLTITVTNGAIA